MKKGTTIFLALGIIAFIRSLIFVYQDNNIWSIIYIFIGFIFLMSVFFANIQNQNTNTTYPFNPNIKEAIQQEEKEIRNFCQDYPVKLNLKPQIPKVLNGIGAVPAFKREILPSFPYHFDTRKKIECWLAKNKEIHCTIRIQEYEGRKLKRPLFFEGRFYPLRLKFYTDNPLIKPIVFNSIDEWRGVLDSINKFGPPTPTEEDFEPTDEQTETHNS